MVVLGIQEMLSNIWRQEPMALCSEEGLANVTKVLAGKMELNNTEAKLQPLFNKLNLVKKMHAPKEQQEILSGPRRGVKRLSRNLKEA